MDKKRGTISIMILLFCILSLLLTGCGSGSSSGGGSEGGDPGVESSDPENEEPETVSSKGALKVGLDFYDGKKEKSSSAENDVLMHPNLGNTADDVVTVNLTVSWPDGTIGPVVCNKSNPSSGWTCSATELPTGVALTLNLSAGDVNGDELYTGNSEVTLSAGEKASVDITMVAVDNGHTHYTPVVKSVTTPANVIPGGEALIEIDIVNQDEDLVTVAVSSSTADGAFSVSEGELTSGLFSTTYTAGITPGDTTITIKLVDASGLSSSKSVTLQVLDNSVTGNINFPPSVTAVDSVTAGVQTTFTATATDDKDVSLLTYKWYFDGVIISETTNPVTVDTPAIGSEIKVEVTDADLATSVYIIVWGEGKQVTSPKTPVGTVAVPGSSSVTISWSDSGDADTYNIYWSQDPGLSLSTGILSEDVSTPYIHTNLETGSTYYYLVTAVNSIGESAPSQLVQATTASAIFQDDFESGMGGWSVENGTWELGEPTSGPGIAFSGINVAGSVLGGNYPNTNSRLISPPVNLPMADPVTGEDIILRFWHWFSIGSHDTVYVQVSEETAPGTWSNWVNLISYAGGSSTWTYPLVDLSAYSGKKVKIAFHILNGSDGYGRQYTSSGWYLDDISIRLQRQIVDMAVGTVFSEDFENGLGNWSVHNGTWEVGAPTSGPESAYSGANTAGSVLSGDYPNTNSKLFTPPINLPLIGSDEELQLRFWHWFSIGSHDRVYVQVSEETAPGTWSTWVNLTSYAGGSSVWTYPLVDLSAYSGKKVKIAFHILNGSDGYGRQYTSSGWYIDEVSIDVKTTLIVDADVPFFEDFENGLGNWSMHNGTWELGESLSGPNEAYSGVNVAGSVLSGNYPNTNSILVSPSMELATLAAGEELRLRFWHWFSIGSHDTVYVKVSEETAPGTWSSWVSLTSYAGGSSVWTYPLIDLSAYSGKKVKIAFHILNGSDGYGRQYTSSGWYIDDVSIVKL